MRRLAAFGAGSLMLFSVDAGAQSLSPFLSAPGGPPAAGMLTLNPQASMRRVAPFRPTAARDVPTPPSPGPEFHFRNGAMQMDVVCGDRTPVRDCAEAAAGLLERFAATGGAATTPMPLLPLPPDAVGKAAPEPAASE